MNNPNGNICFPLVIKPKRIGKTPITYIYRIKMIFCAWMTFWIKKRKKLYNYLSGIKNESDIKAFKLDLYIFRESGTKR